MSASAVMLSSDHDSMSPAHGPYTRVTKQTCCHQLHCRAGKHLIVFLDRGPFVLVMVAATGEPEAALMCQLGLVHGQILSILSSSVEKMFARNPSYDARKLLGRIFFMTVT